MASDVTDLPPPAARPQRSFFGEPKAIAYLAFTEAWERFSFYGMSALMVLYMTQALLLPGRVEHVAGFAAVRGALQAVFGPMSPLALASQVFGLYSGFVYFTPVLGGLIADRWIGRRNAVMAGAILMSAGHFAMAFDGSFLLALVLLITGCGLLKGNISAQVGGLYPEGDDKGRTRGFAIFSMGINVGATAGPLACGLLAQVWGWHAGFALAGVLMLLALATYLFGYRHLPEMRAQARAKAPRRPLAGRDWRIIGALAVVMATTIFQSVIYYQNSDVALIWIQSHVDLDFLGFRVPTAWFGSIDPFASIVFVPPLFALWRRQASRGREPGALGKIAVGVWMATGANLILVLSTLAGPRTSVLAPFAYDVILGIAFLYYWPTLLAVVSRASPPQVKATMMGVVFLTLFIGNILVGWIGGFYERMGPAGFWALQVGIGVAGGLVLLALGRPLERALAAHQAVEEDVPEVAAASLSPASP
ncbi:MAG TPA: peptide MFS transporter [Caulobacteraceae bacterium]|nr:peptide MFS transporter [Caulobacteraceae bacterium]